MLTSTTISQSNLTKAPHPLTPLTLLTKTWASTTTKQGTQPFASFRLPPQPLNNHGFLNTTPQSQAPAKSTKQKLKVHNWLYTPNPTQRPLTTALQSQLVHGLQTLKTLPQYNYFLRTRPQRHTLTSIRLSQKLSSNTEPNHAHSHLRYNGLNSAQQRLRSVLGSTAYFKLFTLLTDRKETTTNSYHAKSFAKSKIYMSFYAICRLNFQYLAKILTMVLMR